MSHTEVPIRDAATVIVVRDCDTAPKVLMGQRGAKAAFMPNKFVFPGGAVDAGDYDIALTGALPQSCAQNLSQELRTETGAGLPHAAPVAAIRELWEETGLILGQAGDWADTPAEDWRDFAARGFVPDAAALRFVFRAITPPGRPRRFDARFFLLDAQHIAGDPDDFSAACDELSHLQWVDLDQARQFDLPFITEVVLAEVSGRLPDLAPPKSVPFYHSDAETMLFRSLKGRMQTAQD